MTGSRVEILLVEDIANGVELTLHAVKKHNRANPVQVVRDAAEALDFPLGSGAHAERDINQHRRVILLDLKLPKIDGLEVLKRVKADARTKLIPVVVLTSSREESDRVESYKLSANSYICKPADFDQFTGSMRTLGMYWLPLNEPPPSAS